MNLLAKIRNCSLRTKFVLPVSAMLVVSILIISGYLTSRQAKSFHQELQTSGETMIRIVAINAESGVLFESQYELDEVLQTLSRFEAVIFAAVTNKEGTILSRYGNWDEEDIMVKRVLKHEKPSDGLCTNYFIESRSDQQFIEMNYPVLSRKEVMNRENLGITAGVDKSLAPEYVTEEIGSLKLVLSLAKVNESISYAWRTTALLIVGVLMLAILVLTFFARVVTRPIKMLVQVTDQVSRGDLDQRVDIKQHDEIGHLANTFNHMIESLRQSRDEIERYNRTLEERIEARTQELEQAQAQLIQSEKMGAIGQLAAGVAHELNNPLGGILGYAQFALEKMHKNISDKSSSPEMDKYVRYLRDIETQARRCKSIVQNLLRFSRASHGTKFEKIDVNKIVEDTVTFVEHQLHMHQIAIQVALDPNLPTIQGDAGQLQQVFTNLIINAMHASTPESEIKIISRFSPAVGEFGGAVELWFVDQGTGIAPEYIKKIFEPFFTTKDVGRGTGLGLSVSYGIVRSHGGEIRVDSTPGEGTTFAVILPVQGQNSSSDNQSVGQVNEPSENRSW
ncbi:MAG: ATP-binding protein [bacterium]